MADQTTTERFIADTSDYVRRVEEAARRADAFGRSNSETALAARRMGLAASEAADRAGRAMREAANAAERLAREEISADEAARAAARGARELERADIAQAAAARAAARATNELADQQRRAAEAAVLAAGMQRLAALRAQGNIRDHNLLLSHLRRNYNGLGDDVQGMASRAGRAFGLVQRAGTTAMGGISKAGEGLAGMGPLLMVGLGLVLLNLPLIASTAAAGITLALGGGLAAVGLMAAAKNAEVKASFADMTSFVGKEMQSLAKPFVGTLMQISKTAKDVFTSFEPTLKSAFATMAPSVSNFAKSFGVGLAELRPAIASVGSSFSVLLDKLGPQMPVIMHNIGTGIQAIAQAASEHASDFVALAMGFSVVVRGIGDLIHGITSVGGAFKWLNPLTGALLTGLSAAGINMKGAATASNSTAAAFADMGKKTQTAADAAKELKTNLDALTGTALSAREAAASYAEALFAVNKSLHDNGAAHGFATVKGVANERALSKLAETAKVYAERMTADGKSTAEVSRYMDGARESMVQTAKKMGYTSLEAQLLANRISGITKRLSELPSGKKIRITADISAAMQNIYTVSAAAAALGAGVKVHAAAGGYIGYADGGPVRHYAYAGPVVGRGTGTSDEIDAKLSNGEYVMRAASTAMNRAALDAANYQGAQLVAVSRSSGWGKTSAKPNLWGHATYDPWGKDNAGGGHTTTWMPPHHGLQSYGSQSGKQQGDQIHIYVAGSVTTENDLLSMIQTKALQQGKTFTLPAGR